MSLHARASKSVFPTHETQKTTSPWVMRFVPNRPSQGRVICFPHAGSGAAAFRGMTGRFFQDYEMLVVQYPGRETRIREGFTRRMEDMVSGLISALRPFLNGPYMVFGHSMGSKISYETLLRFQAEGMVMPSRYIVSCSPSPFKNLGLEPAYKKPDEEFLAYLMKLGGVPEELVAMPDLLQMVLPILRADFELLDHYRIAANRALLGVPLLAIASPQDHSMRTSDVDRWGEVVAGDCHRLDVQGGHFYFPKINYRFQDILSAWGAGQCTLG